MRTRSAPVKKVEPEVESSWKSPPILISWLPAYAVKDPEIAADRPVVQRRTENVSESAPDDEVGAGRVLGVVADLGHVDALGLRRVAVPVLGVLEREDAEGAEELVQPRAVIGAARVLPSVVGERRGDPRGARSRRTARARRSELGVGKHAAHDRGALERVQRHLARVLVLNERLREILAPREARRRAARCCWPGRGRRRRRTRSCP